MADPIPADIRDELDQTPAWWDRQYRALLAETFTEVPFDPAEHEGHDLLEERTFTSPPRLFCTECPTRYTPKETR